MRLLEMFEKLFPFSPPFSTVPKFSSFSWQQRPFAVPHWVSVAVSEFPQPTAGQTLVGGLMKSHLRTIFTTQKHFIDCTLKTPG